MPAPGHPIGGPTKNSLKAEAEYYKKQASLPRSSFMKRVEAYEVNGTLYRSKDDAEVANWASKYYDDQYKSGRRLVGDPVSLVIKWLMSVGWKAP